MNLPFRGNGCAGRFDRLVGISRQAVQVSKGGAWAKMPMGNPRLDAVLRAGQARQLMGATYSGKPGDSSISYRNKPSIGEPAATDDGEAGSFPKGIKKLPEGYSRATGGGAKAAAADKDELRSVSSEVVKDVVAAYQDAAKKRAEVLQQARDEAKQCAERRAKAVTEYQKSAEAAADAAIADLQKRLADKQAELEQLQSASDETLNKLGKLESEGNSASARAQQAIEELKAEKESLERQLQTKIETCDAERDAAKEAADAALAQAIAEGERKLAECEAKNAQGEASSAKELEECNEKLEKATADLAAKTAEHNALVNSSAKDAEEFRAAARAACKALEQYTKE